MLQRSVRLLQIAAILAALRASADLSYVPKPAINDPWLADSLFVGAGLLARSDECDVVVSLKGKVGGCAVGEFFFACPRKTDSTHFLFTNHDTVGASLNLGRFRAGTQLFLGYVVVDTNEYYEPYRGARLYSGQNRPGVDAFVSERSTHYFGHRLFLAGRADSAVVEGGFEDGISTLFWHAMVKVSNVWIEGIEKHKTPMVRASPPVGVYSDSVVVTLSVPEEGLQTVSTYRFNNPCDTLAPLDSGALLEVFYTTDGSAPDTLSTHYDGPIVLQGNTTLRAIARLKRAVDWYASDVATYSYTVQSSVALRRVPTIRRPPAQVATRDRLYDLRGRPLTPAGIRLPAGVYLRSSPRHRKPSAAGYSLVRKRPMKA